MKIITIAALAASIVAAPAMATELKNVVVSNTASTVQFGVINFSLTSQAAGVDTDSVRATIEAPQHDPYIDLSSLDKIDLRNTVGDFSNGSTFVGTTAEGDIKVEKGGKILSETKSISNTTTVDATNGFAGAGYAN